MNARQHPRPHDHAVRLSIQAELRTPLASVQLIDLDLADSIENELVEPGVFRLDLGLTPRPSDARLRFSHHWAGHRFKRPGHLFLLPPNETVQFRSGIGHQRLLQCRLHSDSLQQWLETDIEWTPPRLDASLNITNANIRDLMLRLGREARNPGLASEFLLESVATQLAIELLRHYEGITEASVSGGLSEWRLRRIEERLTDGTNAPSLTELASLCKLSVRHLSRAFQLSRGISLGQYVMQKRMEQAQRLLETGDSVKSVAYSLGFSSPSSFCYAFRQATGRSPGHFKRQISLN